MRILVLHGPNLNLLGHRQPDLYGTMTLAEINDALCTVAKDEGVDLQVRQSNAEGELVSWIQEAPGAFEALVINLAAFSHTSIALRDALEASGLPAVEVHLTNIYRREAFRQHSLVAQVVVGQVVGFGPYSYLLGLRAAIEHLRQPARQRQSGG